MWLLKLLHLDPQLDSIQMEAEKTFHQTKVASVSSFSATVLNFITPKVDQTNISVLQAFVCYYGKQEIAEYFCVPPDVQVLSGI